MSTERPSLHALNLNLLVSLRALLREGSVSAAARCVGVTQSAMSRSLAQLRSIFDDPLLVRVGRQMVPTPRAEALQAPLEGALRELERVIRADTGFDPAQSTRTFRLMTADSLSVTVLPGLLQRVSAAAPGVRLSVVPLSPAAIVPGLASGDLDAVLGGPLQDPVLETEVWFEDGWAWARWGSAERWPEAPDLDTYLAPAHLLVSPFGGPGSVVGRALERVGRQRRVGLEVPYFLAAPALLTGTDWVLTAPAHVIRHFAGVYGLQWGALPFELPPFRVAWLTHRRMSADPAVVWLGQIARAHGQRSPGALG